MKSPSKIQRGFLGTAIFTSIIPLPFAGIIWAFVLTKSSFPLEQVAIGTICGVVALFYGFIAIPILWSHEKWPQIKLALFAFLLIDLGWFPVKWYRDYSTRPYSREEFAFKKIESHKADISGIWKGNWTDPKTLLSESITLDLRQEGNEVKGTITAEDAAQFDIIDGLISGNQINFFYNFSSPEFSRSNGVGTLLGKIRNDQISGIWYAHQRPSPGHSRNGPWNIHKIAQPKD